MRLLPIIAVLVVTFGISSAEAAKRVALVIGNDSYKSLPDLNNARTDAHGMAKKLEELGWTVILKQNASRRDIFRSLAEFERRLKTVEAGMVFYAGHGIQKDGANYLVPSNAQIEDQDDLDYEGISADKFLEAMERAGSPLNIVILDACRDNPLPQGTRSGARGLSVPVIPKGIEGTAIVYSAAPGQAAQDGPDGGHGIFTGELLKVLDRPGLKLEEVFKETARQVVARTNSNQKPWINSSLTGDFYFREAKTPPTAVTKTTKPSSTGKISKETKLKQEMLLWETVKDSKDASMYEAYLEQFPKGTFAAIARIKLQRFDGKAAKEKRQEEQTKKITEKKQHQKLARKEPQERHPPVALTTKTENSPKLWNRADIKELRYSSSTHGALHFKVKEINDYTLTFRDGISFIGNFIMDGGNPYSPGHRNVVAYFVDDKRKVLKFLNQPTGSSISYELEEEWNVSFNMRWQLSAKITERKQKNINGFVANTITVQIKGEATDQWGSQSSWHQEGIKFNEELVIEKNSNIIISMVRNWKGKTQYSPPKTEKMFLTKIKLHDGSSVSWKDLKNKKS